MPSWVWIVIGVGGALLVAAAVTAAVLAWKAFVRRVLLRLLVRAEAVDAAAAALVETVTHLFEADDEARAIFAENPDSVERRALEEVRGRAMILADELDHMPLPNKLVEVAEALADAAVVVRDQAGLVKEGDTGDGVLDDLSETDLELVSAYQAKARTLIREACDACGLEGIDDSVYGGGLYL